VEAEGEVLLYLNLLLDLLLNLLMMRAVGSVPVPAAGVVGAAAAVREVERRLQLQQVEQVGAEGEGEVEVGNRRPR
jgi:hypothetical protein